MKKSRRQLEEERVAEEQQRAARKERRRRAREALERDELADEVAAGAAGAAAAAVAIRARDGFFEEERQGMDEVLQPGPSLSLPGAPLVPLYSAHFLRRFACVAALGVALTCGVASSWRRNNPLPRFELGSSSLVSIRSMDSSRAYLQLSTQDGLLRASATSADEVGTSFRVLVLSSSTVRALRLAAASREAFSEDHDHKGRTKSGCRCSGFSNEHGFGRFCHPWESISQV